MFICNNNQMEIPHHISVLLIFCSYRQVHVDIYFIYYKIPSAVPLIITDSLNSRQYSVDLENGDC